MTPNIYNEEYEARQVALQARREKFQEATFQGHVKAAIMAVKLLPKPWTIADISKVVKKERKHVVLDRKKDFDTLVQGGLKEELRNYFN